MLAFVKFEGSIVLANRLFTMGAIYRLASLTLCLIVIGLVRAEMTEVDRNNWLAATRKYIGLHDKGLFTSYRTNLDSYAGVEDLQRKALERAKRTGVIHISTLPADPEHPWGVTYFSSVIKPGTPLAHEMGLGNKVALAFWKHDDNIFRLLHIDTLGPSKIEVLWPVQPFKQVLDDNLSEFELLHI